MAIPVVTLGPKLIDIKSSSPSTGDMIEWNGTNFVVVGKTGTGSVVRATSPTLTTPTIADLTNMTHIHQGAASGGSLDAAAIGSGTLLNGRVNWASPSDIGTTMPAAGTFTAWRVLQNSAANTIGAASSGRPYLYFDFPQQTSRWSAGFAADSPFSNNFVIASSGDDGATYTQRMTVSNFGAVAMAVIAPLADSTTALKFTKADGATAVMTVDTTNSRVGIGVTPSFAFHIVDSTFNLKASLATGLQVATGSANAWTNLGAPGNGIILAFYNSSGTLVGQVANTGIMTIIPTDAATATVTAVAIFDHTGGTTAAGFGTSALWKGKSSSQSRELVDLQGFYNNPTDASYTTYGLIRAYYMNAGTPTARNAIGWGADGTGSRLGFHSVASAPILRPANANEAAVTTTAAVQITPWGFATQAQADGIVTLVNAIRQVLVDYDLMKGAA